MSKLAARVGRRSKPRSFQIENLEPRRLMHGEHVSGSDHLHEINEFGEVCAVPSVEASLAAAAEALVAKANLSAATYTLGTIPVLNSLVGAAATLYLDFNGHFDAVWGEDSNISTPAYDQDGSTSSFSDGELASMRKIWEYVAEDYAPFNINVTTVEPASFANAVAQRIVIGGDGAWTGGSYGGIAYINSFTNNLTNSVYVFPKNLGNGYAKYVADAASHEAGHGFGLEHQSRYDAYGRKVEEYSTGANGLAPIMGDSYDAVRSVWANGQTRTASTYQNDMAVIARSANGFGYRGDDHGNTVATATALVPAGTQVQATGIITTAGDADYFSFTSAAGQVTFSVTVPTVNNLDARLELRSATGTLLASAAPTTSFGATISTTLAAGTYRLVVASQGAYGDVGQYVLAGAVAAPSTAVLHAPTSLAATAGANGVVLTWQDNAASETGYTVERSTDGVNWPEVASLSANATTFDDSAVVAGGSYSYRVRAIEGTAVSEFSNVGAVTLVPSAPGALTAVAVNSGRVDLSWSNVNGETGYKVERSTDGVNWVKVATTAANITSAQIAGLNAGTAYQFRVTAVNAAGDSPLSNVATATTLSAASVPAAPSNLSGYAISSRQVRLSWRDNSSNETAFAVQRSADGGRTWVYLGTVGPNSTGAIDASAVAGRVYVYRVSAVNEAGSSAFSNLAKISTPRFSFARATFSRFASALPADETPVIMAPAVNHAMPIVRTTELAGENNRAVRFVNRTLPAIQRLQATEQRLARTVTAEREQLVTAPNAPTGKSAWQSSVDEVLAEVGGFNLPGRLLK